MDLNIKGKKALVLGSSSGLGFAISKALSEEGVNVAVTSRELKRAEDAAKQLKNATSYACDLLAKDAGKKILELVGPIDILVTNAGGPPKGNFLDLTSEDWEKGYQGLWMSAIQAIQGALPYMKKQKWGRIILCTSTSAKQPISELTISNAYRPGLHGMMKSLAQEIAPYGITVNAIMPGSTRTKRIEDLKVPIEKLIEEIPAKRLGEPEEFAALATFLASEPAAYITGQSIACDGGLIRGI
ncbi:MAG: SDR family oxidoreductase [Chlamydiales bacterium]|nr:SDR family oxidoreductase [Chlamydiia bacterium]MCP5504640.1 SDR family oxidoreductase [Chlamydiales bacterium]